MKIDEVYAFLSYGPKGFKHTQKRWDTFNFLMNIKRKTGHHLLVANGNPFIYEVFPEVPKEWRI